MGCGGSKMEEQEAVALCRGRSDLLADAIRHRYALAAAHSEYADSLLAVSAALHRLLLQLLPSSAAALSASPLLPLPAHRKPDPSPPTSPPPAFSSSRHSRSHSGSHLHFHPSDSDDSDSDSDDSPLHSGDDSPFQAEAFPASFTNIYYARSQPSAPSVAVEHRPSGVEAVRFEPSSDFSYYGYPNAGSYQSPPSYSYIPSGYGGMDGLFGPNSPPAEQRPPPPAAARTGSYGSPSSSSSKAPPPPPSPPRASTWDFLNPFESYESFYRPYTPSRSSKEVRDEEGIPDLEEEEEEAEQEVVKEAYGDQTFAASTSGAVLEEHPGKKASAANGGAGEHAHYHQPRSVAAGGEPDHEPQVVDKNVVSDDVRRPAAAPRRFRDDSEVVGEIKMLFDRAAESAKELSEVLEVGKQPYHPKLSVYEVSSRMVGVMTPPFASTNSDSFDYEEDKVANSEILSETLQKLYMWEMKLYDEVRTEEKIRLLLDKNCKRLKRLDERGAEAHKVDATQTLIRKLSTKIRIAIHVVDSISKKINKLRDEELWPQINQLIQGLSRMWKLMLECHKTQCQAISEAKSLDSVVSTGKLRDGHFDVMMQLEVELLKWVGNFSAWVSAQKNYVKALNGWLTLCLHYEPEETADGIPPYSPGRIDAPPLFVICNCWSQAMERFSEGEVVDAMHAFAATLRHICEQHSVSQNQRMMAIRDMDRWLKTVEKKTQEIHKEVDTLNRKLALVPGQTGLPVYGVVHQGHTAEVSSLQLGLRQIFEAMEIFSANSMKAYEELHKRCEEERLARENKKVP